MIKYGSQRSKDSIFVSSIICSHNFRALGSVVNMGSGIAVILVLNFRFSVIRYHYVEVLSINTGLNVYRV